MDFKNKIKTIKNDIPKIFELQKKINNIKSKDDKIFIGMFSFMYLPSLYFFFTRMSNFLGKGEPVGVDYAITSLFSMFFTIAAIFILGGVYNIASSLFRTKEKEKINQINKNILKNIDFEYKKELMEILKKNNELSDLVKQTKEVYFNKREESEYQIIANILVYIYKKEKVTMAGFYDFYNYAKANNEEEYHNFIVEILRHTISNLDREEFFKNKNKLIDIVVKDLSLEYQESLSKSIKEQIEEYNNLKSREKDVLEDLFNLKKEDDILKEKTNVVIMCKDKNLIVKSI